MIGSPGDDVLRWASECGSGTWRALNETCAHALQVRGIERLRPWQLAADLASLGHIDIDWSEGRWSASPPALVLSRGMGLCAYLVGWRPTGLLRRFDAFDDVSFFPFRVEQEHAPAAMFAKCGTVETAEAVASSLEIPILFDPASQLASLVSLGDYHHRPAAPPPADEDVDRFDAHHIRWAPTSAPFAPGLHQYELHGRMTFRLHVDDDWFEVDRAAGQLAVLRGRDDVVRWHPASKSYDAPPILTVNRDVSLPPLAERAAVAASGLLPRRHKHQRIYRNVSSKLALALGDALGLGVKRSNEHLPSWKEAG